MAHSESQNSAAS